MNKKKEKGRSEVALVGAVKNSVPEEIEVPLDTLVVKIFSLRMRDEDPRNYNVKVTYFDQLIVNGIIKTIGAKDSEENIPVTLGTMTYDPSDYEKMCMFADYPIVVNVQPAKLAETDSNSLVANEITSRSESAESTTSSKQPIDVSCCNVDILPIFLNDEENSKMCIKKRLEPLIKPTALQQKSWDCLPLLTMEISVFRNKENTEHHKIFKNANWMKLTLIGSYNMIVPFNHEYVYTAASKTPLYCEGNTGVVTFNQGAKPFKFNARSFYPKWESLRVGEDLFTRGDEKFVCKLEDIRNDDNINLKYYLTKRPLSESVVWGSFHRSLILKKSSEKWLLNQIRKHQWPLEVHIYGEDGGFSFMAFLNLFRLLYPGERTVLLAVPLQWINPVTMSQACDCQLLLTPNEKEPATHAAMPKTSRLLTDADVSTEGISPIHYTGPDDNDAFVIVEVQLARPLKKVIIPTPISTASIKDMLKEMEKTGLFKRRCSGRGQLPKDWKSIVKAAATSLRRVPYYGITEFCTFSRQLSETRTRVELTTSCWKEAAVYVNNNFVIQQYLHSEEIFEEMVLMTHACLMRLANDQLLSNDEPRKESDPLIRSARQARQMQDINHAMELYMQQVVNKPRDANSWRELSTCLKDIDRDWAEVCLNKAVVLDPRHPLTLLSKGGMVFEVDPPAAEKFFLALLAYYPFWTSAWIISSAYYYDREHFTMADKLLDIIAKNRRDGNKEELGYSRSWERELGDWWDFTPILTGMTPFFDAADLLLRLRCIPLAEVCMARALTQSGETPSYYHLVALCCRLRGEYQEALCHLGVALGKYGEIHYLKSLEAECYHRTNNVPAALAAYKKARMSGSGFTILMTLPTYKDPQRVRSALVDLVRRQPSAYAWMALANDWMKQTLLSPGDSDNSHKTEDVQTAKACAAACAVQALKFDRRAGCAWALLGNTVKPSARRHHCVKMAALCGYKLNKDCIDTIAASQQSSCYRLGIAITECKCPMCKNMKL